MLEVSEILGNMVKEIAGTRYFCGSATNSASQAVVVLAKACTSYKIDVDEEVNWDDAVTCYNCRYRRWSSYGFSCYKDFPIKKDLSKGDQDVV